MTNSRILYSDFFRLDITVAKAEGSFLWDDKGKKYIDFTSGWNVANLGWNHPEVNEAVREQEMDLKRLLRVIHNPYP
jgi:acetylornithine/N-succinyldiaminopimelate aminotransferase